MKAIPPKNTTVRTHYLLPKEMSPSWRRELLLVDPEKCSPGFLLTLIIDEVQINRNTSRVKCHLENLVEPHGLL